MGCDGGTIPKRDELIKTKKKQHDFDKDAHLVAKWQYCALSSTRLQEPIVSCELGRLYNKTAVIEYLLNRKDSPSDVAAHIRTLKDVTELKLTLKKPDETTKKTLSTAGGEYVDNQDSAFICPVVGLEMSGKYKFCYISLCGCVVSERALKEVKSETCHGCGREYDSEKDVIVMNGSPEEVEDLRLSMEERRSRAKQDKKKSKKRGKEIDTDTAGHDAAVISKKKKPQDTDPVATTSNDMSKKSSSSSSSSTTKASTSCLLTEKARSDYSVAKDPNASESYKSLFTTHSSAKNKPKGNWVTFNPLYF